MTSKDTVGPGDVVALVDEKGQRFLLTTPTDGKPAVERVRGVGVIDAGKLVDHPWAAPLTHGNKTFQVMPPGTVDLVRGLHRKAAIVQPKDAARILLECDVRAGSLVVESGVGSGALTVCLARAVAPTGRVVTLELREDFLDWGRKNVARAGLDEYVDLRLGDVTEGIPVTGADAVVLDIPNPWDAVQHAKGALKPGGFIACYSPLVSQVEATHVALGRAGFTDVRTLELIERAWHVGERGSRPDHDMLGHTAFLTFARRGPA